MPNSKQILEALKKADASGNTQDAQKLAKMYKKAIEIENRPKINKFGEGARSLIEGLTFGSSDELGGFGSFIGAKAADMFGPNNEGATTDDNYYKTARDNIRAKQKEFERQNPVLKTGLEIVGGIAIPGGIAKTGITKGGAAFNKNIPDFLKGSTAQGAGYGSLYGIGTADEISDIPENALTGGLIGGGGSKAISSAGKVIAPKVSNLVQKTMARGNELTPGQIFGGLTNTLEQKLGSVVPGVKKARGRTIEKFNREVAEDILKPLGVIMPASIKTNSQASQFITKEIDKSYTKAYQNMQLDLDATFKKSLKDIVKNSGLVGKSKQNLNLEINKIINMIENKSIKGSGKNKKSIANGIKGNNVKNVSKNIKAKIAAYRKSTNVNESPLEDSLQEAFDIFKQNMIKQNPKSGKLLLDTDSVYGQVVQFQKAVPKGGKTGMFTPNQLLTSAVEGMTAPSKRISKANQTGKLQKIANEAEEVLGDYVPDSGTAGNIALNSIIAGFIDPLVLGGFLSAELAYSKPIIKLVNQYIKSGGNRQGLRNFLTKNAPATGLISSQQFNEKEEIPTITIRGGGAR
tara:strand:- start:8 stop:1732 length:1725 start_codon:yes stop_codon:yes gene_type:complete